MSRPAWILTGALVCTAVVTAAATPVRADAPAMRAVLQQMQRVVLAGDAAEYLALVDDSDAIFYKEQENWAADLKRHRPVEFSLEIAPDESDPAAPDEPGRMARTAHFGPDRATFTVRMTWTMGEDVGGAAAKSRSVKYPVEFVRKGDAWRYCGEVWETRQSPADEVGGFFGVRVQYEPGLDEAAEAVVEVMPEVRSKVDAAFGRTLRHVQTVKLYRSMLHLQASIYLSYKDPLGGWNEPGESVKIVQRSRVRPDSLRNLLGHEYGHVATFELGPKSNEAPWWVLEGVADYSAGVVTGKSGAGADRAVIGWSRRGKLADWKDITDFRTTPSSLSGNVYRQGEHFVRWFTERFGDDGRNAWLKMMAEGKTLDEATQAVAAMSFDDADRAWREHVATLVAEADRKDAEKPDAEKPPAGKDDPGGG